MVKRALEHPIWAILGIVLAFVTIAKLVHPQVKALS